METTEPTTEERLARVLDNARLLGNCWRMDWTDFDGRTLVAQIEDLDEDPDQFAAGISACREHQGWRHWCRDQH